MKNIIGLIVLVFAMSTMTIAQSKTDQVKTKIKGEHTKLQSNAKSEVKSEVKSMTGKKAEEAKAKIKQQKGNVPTLNANAKSVKDKMPDNAKAKYREMSKEKVNSLPIAQKVQAKQAIIESKVNKSDMKSAMNTKTIADVEARLNKGLADGSMSQADYDANMQKVAKAKASLNNYKSAIKTGKSLLK